MVITKKQKELDIIKWNKSVEQDYDACGTFDYCIKCNKELENPCDKAYKKFNASNKAKKSAGEVAVTQVKKTTNRCKKSK